MTSIVTLSGFPRIFDQFRIAAEEFEPSTRKILVTSRGMSILPLGDTWTVIEGEEPFVFARNANLGIEAAGRDDVLLVNDDAQLRQPTAAKLAEVVSQHPRVGILSAQVIGQSGGNPLQNRRTELEHNVTLSEQRLAFVCVYIKRALIDDIGLLDERFTGYGCEDDDYCLRAKQADWELAVTPDVVVRHGYGNRNATSSFDRCPHCNGTGNAPALEESAEAMRGVFYQKWGRRP